MKINRRDFLKWSVATAVVLKVGFDIDRANTVMASESDPPVIWLQGSGCSGCSVSFLNVTDPTTVDNVLMDKISLKFNSTINTAVAEPVLNSLEEAANQYENQFILVVEGAIPTGANGNYCIIGESNGDPFTMEEAVLRYAPMAKYIVAAGTCASFGGVSAASPNITECKSVQEILSGKSVNTIVNLPSCPAHPTILVQTLLDLILTGVPRLTSSNSPRKYYNNTVHSMCPRKEDSDDEQVNFGIDGCYRSVGCNGPSTSFNCPSIKWNNGINWCIESNIACIGCADDSFPKNPIFVTGASESSDDDDD